MNPSIVQTKLHPATVLGQTTLAVADLPRSIQFYQTVIGMQALEITDSSAKLGVGDQVLLVLQSKPDAIPQPPQTTGLYHMAILVPSRADLAHLIAHIAEVQYPLSGYSDHLVSEAFYLDDPDGNGLELYRDRPREDWRWVGTQVQMDNAPIDMQSLFAELPEKPWTGLPAGTIIGHMHLRVGEVKQAVDFYTRVLGFDLVSQFPGAGFISAGKYHHHLGLNMWQSRNAPPAPANSVGLVEMTVRLANAEERQHLIERLQAANVTYQTEGQDVIVADPWQNHLRFVVGK